MSRSVAKLTAVGGDHLGRQDAVAGEPVLADHPADAAAEGVAEHADIGRGAGEVGEAVFAGCDRERLREDPGPDPGAAARDVDRRCRASAPS